MKISKKTKSRATFSIIFSMMMMKNPLLVLQTPAQKINLQMLFFFTNQRMKRYKLTKKNQPRLDGTAQLVKTITSKTRHHATNAKRREQLKTIPSPSQRESNSSRVNTYQK